MPETRLPDFDQIARDVVKANDNADGEDMDGNPAFLPIDHKGHLTSAIAEQLRLVWNARGAADIAMIEASETEDWIRLERLMGTSTELGRGVEMRRLLCWFGVHAMRRAFNPAFRTQWRCRACGARR